MAKQAAAFSTAGDIEMLLQPGRRDYQRPKTTRAAGAPATKAHLAARAAAAHVLCPAVPCRPRGKKAAAHGEGDGRA